MSFRLPRFTIIVLFCCFSIPWIGPSVFSQAVVRAEPSIHSDSATLTVVLDTVPDSVQVFEFTGDLGVFVLDDDAALANGSDVYANSNTSSVPSGVVSRVNWTDQSGYYLTAITCNSPNALVETAFKRIRVTPAPGEVITCTFVVGQSATINVIKYDDGNANGRNDAADSRLDGWQFYALTGSSFNILASDLTSDGGLAALANIEPAVERTVCEVLATNSPYANSEPGGRNVLYNLPCKTLTLEPAQWVAIRFGNVLAQGNDQDGDRIADSVDNCVYRANPTQIDTNGNGIGDVCESTLEIVQVSVPTSTNDFAYTGDLGYFVLDDDTDGTLPAERLFGIETGSMLGSVSTAIVQTLNPEWPLESITCTPEALATVDLAGGALTVVPTTPGQTITCTFVNAQATTRMHAASAVSAVGFFPQAEHDRTVVFQWTIPDELEVAGIDIYVAGLRDGPYLPLLRNMPPAVSGNAIELTAPEGDWYYTLSVRLINGETLTQGPVSPFVPTSAELLYFDLALVEGNVQISWETAVEWNTTGYNLYRSDSVGGSRVKLNDDLIAATGGQGLGSSYSWQDIEVVPGQWWYSLEEVRDDGALSQLTEASINVGVPTAITQLAQSSSSLWPPNRAFWLTMVLFAATLVVGIYQKRP